MRPGPALASASAQHAIALYLQANPLASDTAEGIRCWWLGGAAFSPLAIQQALDGLVRQGVLDLQPAADGHQRYRLAVDAATLRALTGHQGGGDGPGA